VIATTSEPDVLFPPLALNMEARQGSELMYEYLADAGPSMNTVGDSGFVKEIASSWTWNRDSTAISFRLNPLARWHDGRPVTSRDVVFTYSVYSDPKTGAPDMSSLADIDSVTAPDASTAVFWFNRRTPHQFFDASAIMLIIPEHVFARIPHDSLRVAAAAMNPVGSGRYRFGRWNKGSYFEIDAVPDHYRGRAHNDRVIWTVTPEYQTAVTRLLGGDADLFANIRQETVPGIQAKGKLRLITLPGMDYVFLQLNLRTAENTEATEGTEKTAHRIFGTRGVRRAITMALDRGAMVKNLFDSLATVSIGPTVRAYPTTDTSITQIPFDRAGAERLLDSLGWRASVAGGVRSRNGVPLRFTVLVPVSSLSRVRIAVLIQEQLRQAGIDMKIEQMDYSAFSERQADRKFDAALAGWHLGSSPGSERDTWSSDAAKKGGLNYGGYSNPSFDVLLDSALATSSLPDAREYFRRANQIIVDDAPAVWLYEPKTVLAIDNRIKTTPMRPNAWWLDIAGWSIPEDERIARDLVPLKNQQDSAQEPLEAPI
jgi:peptide/nickel transport system substrate-binding protein